jgi:ABC-type multidrug transport system fused ATPase/permease subunit
MGITQIVVAHRLSTIRDCDQIIVMEAGHVVQQGTHEQLMQQDGLYRQLMENG